MEVAVTQPVASGSNVKLDPFDLVEQNLKRLGALTIEDFFSADHLHTDAPPVRPRRPRPPQKKTAPEVKASPADYAALSRLHQASQRTHGSALKFEFLEEKGNSSKYPGKQCILTITRHNGATRSYKTEPVFTKKTDAKAHAANIAVGLGALEFIATGEDRSRAQEVEDVKNMDAEIKQLHEACQHRGAQATPRWYVIKDPKYSSKFGCVLKIQLSMHSFRVYSSDTIFDTYSAAKAECAKTALAEGILDYIKNDTSAYSTQNNNFATISRQIPEQNSLQAFYDSLPRPFPEDFGDKTAIEINAPGYLNTVIQAARGSKFSARYIPFSVPGSYHGCLLRLERPMDCRSYLAEPLFSKRADAKAAACFQAFSEGVCAFIRAAGDATESMVSEGMKKLATGRIIPTLTNEYSRRRPGATLDYQYIQDKDAYGCTLTLLLRDPPGPNESRTYSVPAQYRGKNDAKLALVCVAAQQGAVEFVRYSGRAPPRNYTPFLANEASKVLAEQKVATGKRKDLAEISEPDVPSKRIKLEPQSDEKPVSGPSSPSTSSIGMASNRKRKLSEAGHDDGSDSRPNKQVRSATPQFEGENAVAEQHRSRMPSTGYYPTPSRPLNPGEGSQRRPSAPFSAFEPSTRKDDHSPERLYGSSPAHYYGSDQEQSRQPPYDRSGNGNVYPHGYYSQPTLPPKEEHPDHFMPPPPPRHLPPPLPPTPPESHAFTTVSRSYPDTSNWATPSDGVNDPLRRSTSQRQSMPPPESTTTRSLSLNPIRQRRPTKPVPSHVDELFAYCKARPSLPRPEFHDEMVDNTHHKVWLIMGSERMELSTLTFRTVWEGRQRLAKKVLERLKGG